MATLGLGERLEPVGDLAEALVARLLRHARVHVGVLVRLARYGGLEIFTSPANGQVGGRIAHHLQILQVPVRVPGLTFGGRAKQRRHIVVAFHVGLRGEVQVTPVRLRLAGERGLQIVVRAAAFQRFHVASFGIYRPSLGTGSRLIKWNFVILLIELRYAASANRRLDLRESARHLGTALYRDAELARDLREREYAAHHGALGGRR